MKLKVLVLFFLSFFSVLSCEALMTNELLLELKKPIIVRVVEIHEDLIPYQPIVVECSLVYGSGTVGLVIKEANFSSEVCNKLRKRNKKIANDYSNHFLKKGDLIEVLELEEEISQMPIHIIEEDSSSCYYVAGKAPFRFVKCFRIIKTLKDKLLESQPDKPDPLREIIERGKK